MKLKVIEDNNTYIDVYYLGEPGVSYYIEDEGTKILFDTAYSDAFLKNGKDMGIDLKAVDKLVLSHGHDDHTGGLKFYFDRKMESLELVAHPGSLEYKEDDDGTPICSPLTKEELSKLCKLSLSKEPVKLSKNITFLGQIPRTLDFEPKYSIGRAKRDGKLVADFMDDDSALVYQGKEGIFIITGCSHSGICNIIEYAKKVTGDDRIYGVIGGFHLFDVDERLEATIKYLKKEKIKFLYPCHCVSLDCKVEIGKELKIHEVGVGLEIEYE